MGSSALSVALNLFPIQKNAAGPFNPMTFSTVWQSVEATPGRLVVSLLAVITALVLLHICDGECDHTSFIRLVN